MQITDPHRSAILDQLSVIYGAGGEPVMARIDQLASAFTQDTPTAPQDLWSERDVVLITYADQVRGESGSPLSQLGRFLDNHELVHLVSTVHLLPFCPWSSDDGFSVIDYRQVDTAVGSWNDIAHLQAGHSLMFDLVLNHCSSESNWFQAYLRNESPHNTWFIDQFADADLNEVTRPRSTPLLTAFDTHRGTRHVWTTFSADQIDLDYSNPDVLIEMLDILLDYVSRGARIVRLDAIAYLWKRPGTTCVHLPETHAVVKLMRALLDALAPGTILLTETNVPHKENISYFGDGDEARMVYQFSLAPLLFDAFLFGDARPLMSWLDKLEDARAGNTYFNFTASHDGIGVRPLEGLVKQERFKRLVDSVGERGGRVSTKRNADGGESPYELNISYFSAIAGEPIRDNDPTAAIRAFLTSQAVMLALRGIPGVYFHSLVGTPNDHAGVEETGRARSINRRKYNRHELDAILSNPASPQARVFAGYRKLLATRIAQPAFHPDAEQTTICCGDPAIISFSRTSVDDHQTIVIIANVASEPRVASFLHPAHATFRGDLLGSDVQPERTSAGECQITVEPHGILWLNYQ